MDKQTIKEFLCWMIDKDEYFKYNIYEGELRLYFSCDFNKYEGELNFKVEDLQEDFQWVIDRRYSEFKEWNRDNKLNDILNG